jgi:hypothetical protein
MREVTGRDRHIITKALAIAIRAIETVPPRQQPESDRDDMVKLLKAMVPDDIERELIVRSSSWVVEGIATEWTGR